VNSANPGNGEPILKPPIGVQTGEKNAISRIADPVCGKKAHLEVAPGRR
jgi:hypothetical protein